MPTSVMTDETSFLPPPVPPSEEAALFSALADPVNALGQPGFLGTREQIEKELDLIAAAIRAFYRKQPDQVMRECAGFSARLTELQVLLHRVEAGNRQYTRIRTQQVERFLNELDRQFRTASRLVEVQRQDLELLRG